MANDFNPKIPGLDDAAAAYWNGPISRSETQDEFDKLAHIIGDVKQRLLKQEFATGFIIERLGATPADIQEFMLRKAREYEKQEKEKKDNGGQDTPDTPSLLVN